VVAAAAGQLAGVIDYRWMQLEENMYGNGIGVGGYM
jgi:hypothetical protein